MIDALLEGVSAGGIMLVVVAGFAAYGGAYSELHHYRSTKDAVMLTCMGSGLLVLAYCLGGIARSALVL